MAPLWSILSTFYVRLLCTKVFCFGFKIFWQKDIASKTTRKMQIKSTPSQSWRHQTSTKQRSFVTGNHKLKCQHVTINRSDLMDLTEGICPVRRILWPLGVDPGRQALCKPEMEGNIDRHC